MRRPTFQEFTKWVIISAIIALMSGCGASKHATQVVHDTRVDTVYLNSQQYDSIYIYQDRLLDRSKDTVYLKDVSVEYRYKLLRDTVRIVERDSIPYQVTITETKEIQRPLTWFDQLTRFSFYFLLGVILCWIYYKFGIFKH